MLLPRVKDLNPHIKDLDRIRPGQILNIPGKHSDASTSANSPTPGTQQRKVRTRAAKNNKVSHVVQPGDTVANLLRKLAGLPEHLIFNEYINKFKELNPSLPDINNLEVGQQINVPLPPANETQASRELASSKTQSKNTLGSQPRRPQSKPGSQKKNIPSAGSSPSQPPVAAKKQASKDLHTKAKFSQNEELCRSMLSRIGLNFVKGKELIYPLPSGRWLHLNLQKTPLAKTEWGDLLLFIPEGIKTKIDQAQLRQAGFKLCSIPNNWQPEKVLQTLEDLDKAHLTYWSQGRSLIINSGKTTLELRADFILITKPKTRRRVFLFNRINPQDMDAPNLLQGFLNQKGVHLLFKADSGSGGFFAKPVWPREEDLYVPLLKAEQSWSQLRRLLDKKAQGINPGGSHFKDVYPLLQDLELLEDKPISLAWFTESKRKINISIPAYSLKANPGEVLIFTQATSPYLLHLFMLKGYNCYLLSGS